MNKVKQQRKFSPFFCVIAVLLVLSTAFMFFLFLMAINTSFKAEQDVTGNRLGLPRWEMWQDETGDFDHPNNIFGNYIYSFTHLLINQPKSYILGLFSKTRVNTYIQGDLLSSVFYTVLYALVGALVAAFVPMFMGYLCAKYRNKCSAIIYAVVLFVMATPIIGSTPSMVNLMCSLRLYDTFIGNWLQKAGFTNMYFLIYYAFFSSLSSSFDEAAEIDGASQLSVMFRICMPLAGSIFWTITLMLFVAFWNDYTTPMLYLPTKPTLSYLIYFRLTYMKTGPVWSDSQGKNVPCDFDSYGKRMAVLMVFAIPIIVIFAIFNKQLMTNLTMGGVKE